MADALMRILREIIHVDLRPEITKKGRCGTVILQKTKLYQIVRGELSGLMNIGAV